MQCSELPYGLESQLWRRSSKTTMVTTIPPPETFEIESPKEPENNCMQAQFRQRPCEVE